MSDSTTTAAPAAAAPTPATTSEPSQQSTNPPASTNTTADPGQQSTSAPGAGTTAAPGGGTTAAPGGSTTAAPGAGPTVQATIEINPPDSTQSPTSVQVPLSATLMLTWNATGASTVNISGIGDGQAVSGSLPIRTEDADFTLIAVADGGAESPPCLVSVATHPDGDVVSGHAEIAAGIAAVISFSAMKDSQSITSANVGDSVNLVATVSGSTDSCTIGGQPASLSDSGDGNKQASVSITVAAGMSGDFDCQVSSQGTAGDPSSIHLDIGAASPGITTTLEPGITTTLSPGITTTLAPAGTTTLAPGSTTTVGPNSSSPGTTTTANACVPSTTTANASPAGTTTANTCVNTTTAGPAPTTTAAHPPATTTGESYITIWNTVANLNLPKIDGGDHFTVTLGLSFSGQLECKTAGAQPVSDLPGPWQSKLEDGFTNKFSIPLWQAHFNGYTAKGKDYSDFWSHCTFADTSATKNGGFNAKTEITTNFGEYDVGEYDFATSGDIPVASAKFSIAVAQFNSVEVWKSALGVATGTYSVNLATDIMTDGDYRLTGTYAVTGQIEMKGPTAEEIAEKIAANPVVIEGIALGTAAVVAAAAVGAIVVAYVWAEMQLDSVDVAAALPERVANAARDAVENAFTHSGINSWSDSGGDLTSYYLAAGQATQTWMDSNPDATPDQQAQAKSDFVAGTTSWAQNAVFNAYKNDPNRHPAELINEVHQRIFGTPDPDYKAPLPEGGAP